jgi:hypothetical protein
MGRTKSENRFAGVQTGFYSRWQHVTGNATISPRAGEIVVLHSVNVNTTTASPVILRDSAVGVIATIAASAVGQTFAYMLPLRGDLIIENPGGSDLTITFSND